MRATAPLGAALSGQVLFYLYLPLAILGLVLQLCGQEWYIKRRVVRTFVCPRIVLISFFSMGSGIFLYATCYGAAVGETEEDRPTNAVFAAVHHEFANHAAGMLNF
jgi:hypothetical protein